MKHLLPILAIFILLFQSILTLDGGYLSTKVQQAIIDSKFAPFLEYPKQETSEEPNFGHLPVAFVPNRGQVQDSSVSFQVTHLTGSTFFKPGEFELIVPNQSEPEIASFDNTKATKQKKEPSRLLVQYKNYNNKALVRGINPLPGKANYFYGNDSSQWFTDVETYQGILYEDLYPNIDLVIGGGAGYIKSSLIIAPGADPSLINWKYRGAQDIIIDQQGNLQITAKSKGDPQYFFETAPIAWQTVHGENLSVQVAYQIENNQHISFIFPEGYDTTKELIIDPTLKWGASTKNIPVTTEATLEWGTYIGNNGTDQGFGIDHDSAGNVLVTGYSYCWYYPLVDPIQEQTGEEEIIISKLDPTGSYLLYSTCLGGTGTDKANSIALDQQDNIILVGETDSSDFPIVSGISAYAGGNKDAFVVKINSTGNAVTYSSYMGGSNEERAASVAVDLNGFIYLVGETGSSNFPTTTNAYDRVFGGGTCDGIKCKDIFVAKFDSSLSDLNSILYSTYIGGANRVDKGYDLALDPNNNVYITGYTFTLSGFPLVNAVQGSNNGGSDAFIIKMDLNQSGNNSILFSTYFGGSSNDRGYGIAVDGSGNAYLTGYTESSNFPTMNPYQAEQGGGCSSECSDAYIAKLNTTTSQIVYSSYLGGAGIDEANDVVVDSNGRAYIAGFTKSSNFPVVNPLFSRSIDGCSSAPCADAFITVFDQTGASLVFSTYLGGKGEDVAKGLVLEPGGNLFVTGYSFSDDFPVSSGAYNTTNPENNLKSDVFVAKINSIIPTPTPTVTSSFTDTPVPPTPTNTATTTETPIQPTLTFTITPTATNTPTPTPTQEPLLAWTAESNIEFANFGWSVSTAGDINGDSYDDVVIGAPHYSNGQTNEGAIYLYYGSEDGLGTTPVIIESNEPESLFGWSVSTAGDVNGDGFDDLIIGAIGCTSPEQCEGRAYVFYGTSDGLSATPGWSTMGGKAHSAYGYTVGSADSYIKLIHLRSRMYSPITGRFLTRDTWQGDYTRPLSLNKWNYVSGNPINRVDPLGLWELAPGFNLSEGGIYGKGILEMQGSPIPCKGTCIGPASTDISIFVPPVVNGMLYNDQHYGRYGYTDVRMIKKLIEYDVIERNNLTSCYLDEFIIPKNTNDWKEVYQKIGKSNAFSQGALVDITVSIGVGMGYDSGYSPVDMTYNLLAYYSNNASIAAQLFVAQSKMERERLQMVEIFDNNEKAGRAEAGVGGVVFVAQAWQGVQTFNSRAFVITIEQHRLVPSLYRGRIETTAGFYEVKSHRLLISSYFLSFEGGTWREQLFNLAASNP